MRGKKMISWLLSAVLCLQLLPMTSLAVTYDATTGNTISGNGVQVVFSSGNITLYLVDGETSTQMSKPSSMGYPIINGNPVQDFTNHQCVVNDNIDGILGTGERMTITSTSPSTGLVRTYILETSDDVKGAIYTYTSYSNSSNSVAVDWFEDNVFELYGAEDRIWSYNGGGEGPMHYYDTLQKIDLTDSSTFSRENKQDSTAASIPVADIYAEHGGITVGDASATRREVHTPVMETSDSAQVSIKWPGKTINENAVNVGQSFLIIHSGDYFLGLRGYKNAMETIGVVMNHDVPDRSYELRWDAWGWGFNWSVDQIIDHLDELEAAGVEQIAIDDGWYTYCGDWELDPNRFPNGDADMLRLTNAIHAHGMTALLWWRPCDAGTGSTLYREHPEYFVQNADGSTARLVGCGGKTVTSLGYALCPASAGAIASHVAFINRAMNDWNFDGFKGDYVWSMPKCYNPAHNHDYPEESTEMQSEFYKAAYEAMVENDPDAFNLLCNCGTPLDYYSLQYMTQAITADPTSRDQTRTRAKAYKALLGDYFPVTTDHNDVWYDTAVGTGSVMIEKSAEGVPGFSQSEYERWLDIAGEVQLHKGRFIGDLYSYGYDPYETYVVEKNGVMYYAFYRDGARYSPSGYPDIELRGLDPDKMYRIVDYVNDRIVATNLMGNNAVFNNQFSSSLLVKAVEITELDDPNVVDPDWGLTLIDDQDAALTYTGNWINDSNDSFYEGTARYTSDDDASVEFTFAGTRVRWYGQRDTNFGTAEVYIDGTLVETVNAYGTMASGVKLFEAVDLAPAYHTLKIVRKSGVIDIDKLAYLPAVPELVYERVDSASSLITYTGEWYDIYNSDFYEGSARATSEIGATVEFTFTGTAICWYGQTSAETYGITRVYIDDEFVESAYTYGEPGSGKLIFDATGLPAGTHTIRIENTTVQPIDIDYFAFATEDGSEPEPVYQKVDDRDTALVYTGEWTNDDNNDFDSGTARYTSSEGAQVVFTFTGTAVRWYGQNDVNFGSAKVYVDNALVDTVNVNGEAIVKKLLFEQTGLTAGEHTLRIVCETPVIDVDYFEYSN